MKKNDKPDDGAVDSSDQMERAFQEFIALANKHAKELGSGRASYVMTCACARYFAFHQSQGHAFDTASEQLMVDGATKGMVEAYAIVEASLNKFRKLDA